MISLTRSHKRERYRNLGIKASGIGRFYDLVMALVQRDFKAHYRRSQVGPAWAVIQPLIYLGIFMLVRGVLDIPSDGQPYVLFAYVALVPWTFLTGAITRGGNCIYANSEIIKKIALPKEVFPVAAVVRSLIDFGIACILLALLLLWFRPEMTWHLLWLPVLLALLFCLALAATFGIAALATFIQDFNLAAPFVVQAGMLASPIMYPLSQVPEAWIPYYAINPAVGIIEGLRRVVVMGSPPEFLSLVLSVLVTGGLLLASWVLFRRTSQHYADIL